MRIAYVVENLRLQFVFDFFHLKDNNISNKTHVLPIISHHTLSMLPHYLWQFKKSNLSQIWKKMETKNGVYKSNNKLK